MIDVSDSQFDALITQAMDELPQSRIAGLQNVAIIVDDAPSVEQKEKLMLRGDQTLLGLYEGIPLTKRNNGYNMVLPDKITLFKHPLCHRASTLPELKEEIKHTLWHEIAHYYGLDHDQIYKLEK
jgi:predicted Zn-dependent protease with MMP-like domain